jgi:hypothetical protein
MIQKRNKLFLLLYIFEFLINKKETRRLIKNNFKLLDQKENGKTALELAREYNNKTLIELFEEGMLLLKSYKLKSLFKF